MNMTALAHNDFIQDTIQGWKKISPVIHEPQNIDDYEKLSNLLDNLLDVVGEDESHDLIGLIDVISHMISIYDDEHYQFLEGGTGINALKFLMEQFALNQNDLKNEIGSQGVVSEILNGKRQLNVTQIRKLSDRFKVSPATFID
jgi:HTH-type transcriptional regulator/antitoxin HigA